MGSDGSSLTSGPDRPSTGRTAASEGSEAQKPRWANGSLAALERRGAKEEEQKGAQVLRVEGTSWLKASHMGSRTWRVSALGLLDHAPVVTLDVPPIQA
jgi:hypothetical protein